MSHDATSDEYAIEHNLGRPRSVLVLGSFHGPWRGSIESGGARVVDVTAGALRKGDLKGGPFDLGVLHGDELVAEGGAATLRQLGHHLSDGGHLLVWVGEGSIRSARKLLEDAGFELLRVDAAPRWGRGARVTAPVERVIATQAPKLVGARRVVMARKRPRPGKLSVTIGMLTLNEEKSVEAMIDEIRAVAPDAKLLLIDSSSDRTPALAEAKGARVIRQLPPRGHGPAMERLMYEAAKESDALVYLDCDFTYPTAYIPRIRELLEGGADVVNASRTATYPKAMPVPNFLANRLFAATARAVHGVPTTDVHSGMRGYRSSMVRAFSFDGEGDALPLDTLILPARSNYQVVEFPIPYAERVGESKLAKFRGTMWTFLRIAEAIGQGTRVSRRSQYRVLEGGS